MARGICPVCGELVKIVEGPPIKEGFSARYWWITGHPLSNKECKGSGRKI